MGDSKYIIVCCDGTANDGTVAAPDGVDPQLSNISLSFFFPPLLIRRLFNLGCTRHYLFICLLYLMMLALDQFPTNVARIARSLAHRAINKQRQIVFYQKGVGTESVFNGEPGTGSTWNPSKIREAYTFIAQNYNDGDEIFLFGFSRGAYTARKVAGLIDRIGLLSMQNIGSFFHIWLELLHDKSPTLPPDTKSPSIKAVAVFDTVNSVYQSPIQYNDALSIKDTSFPETVAVGLHALSFHENRVHYLPTLWTIPKGGLKPNQHMKQVWFPGDHADVGGGWDRHELSDISIAWMVGELKFYYPNLAFDANRLHSFHQVNPEPWGTSKPHWSWSPAIFLDRSQTNQLTTESILHSSLLVSPTSLGFLNVQITMKKLFGDPAKYPKPMPLNDFERVCKENWGKMALITLPGDPVPENPVWAATDGAGKDLYVGSAEGCTSCFFFGGGGRGGGGGGGGLLYPINPTRPRSWNV
ncbi:hypothetical protein DL96DRAFT_1762112 [Flagelloscypha sp. PMI_526]|nr:hypothetical protein DL96DRAFT_1762112 [Flagelloscypha sp. PMI_526]